MKTLHRWEPRQSKKQVDVWGIVLEPAPGQRDKEPQWIMQPNDKLDREDVAMMVATHNARVDFSEQGEKVIWCNSIVNTKLEPRIEIVLGPETVQMDIRQARQHVSQLYEAIEAAISDALVCHFVKDYVYPNTTPEEQGRAMATLLSMFREFRKSFEPTDESESTQ